MAPNFNVFWKTGVDFRAFDISVPAFSFFNNNNRAFNDIYGSAISSDELRLNDGSANLARNSFFGSAISVNSSSITGGTIDKFVDWAGSGASNYNGYIEFRTPIAAADLNAVIATSSTADDLAFLRRMLGGDDAMDLSGGFNSGIVTDDYAFGAAGQDTIYGNRGNDTLLGDSGNDNVFGDQGNDSLFGGTGQDYVSGWDGADFVAGGKGNDQLYGGNGADVLRGDAGTDTLYGGAGADQFSFRSGAGTDYIKDWQDGVDKIRVEAPGGTTLNIAVDYTGTGAKVTFLNVTIYIDNVANNSIKAADDFILVGI